MIWSLICSVPQTWQHWSRVWNQKPKTSYAVYRMRKIISDLSPIYLKNMRVSSFFFCFFVNTFCERWKAATWLRLNAQRIGQFEAVAPEKKWQFEQDGKALDAEITSWLCEGSATVRFWGGGITELLYLWIICYTVPQVVYKTRHHPCTQMCRIRVHQTLFLVCHFLLRVRLTTQCIWLYKGELRLNTWLFCFF